MFNCFYIKIYYMKRIISIILSILLLTSCDPGNVVVKEHFTEKEETRLVSSDEPIVTITSDAMWVVAKDVSSSYSSPKISVRVLSNTQAQPRAAKVVATRSNATTLTIEITQDAASELPPTPSADDGDVHNIYSPKDAYSKVR